MMSEPTLEPGDSMTQQQVGQPVQLTVVPGDWEQVAAQASQRAAQTEAALNAAIRRIRELEQTLAQPESLADASPNGVPKEAQVAAPQGEK